METVLDQLVELQNQLAKYKALKAESNRLQKLFKKTQDEHTAINMDYLDKETAFFREQAGIMAGTLEEGKPCPVCGSTTHPNKAVPTADAPSEEELKSLKEKADISREDMERASNQSATKLTEEKLAKDQLYDASTFSDAGGRAPGGGFKIPDRISPGPNNENKKESDDKYLKLKDQLLVNLKQQTA